MAAANPDAVRNGSPVDTVAATDFGNGINTWDLDAIGVTDLGSGRSVTSDGSGVYVAVLDTGLVDQWRKGQRRGPGSDALADRRHQMMERGRIVRPFFNSRRG